MPYNPVTCENCNSNDTSSHDFTWKQYSVPSEVSITGCWVFGENDIYLVGTNNVYHFDGNNFVSLDLHYRDKPTIHVSTADDQIFALSKTDFWLIIDGQLLHCDGKLCDDYRPQGAANAAWGTSSNDMFFVGNGGAIYHYDGTTFTRMNSGTTQDLHSVWGIDDNHIWACGLNIHTSATAIVFYNGNQWNIDDLTNNSDAQASGLSAIWATDSAISHKFVITSDAYVFQRTDLSPWRIDKTIPNYHIPDSSFREGLYLLRGNSANDLWGAGDRGWAGHWNGKTWKRYDELYDPKELLQPYIPKAMSVNGNTVCIVGFKSGNSWVAIGTRKQ